MSRAFIDEKLSKIYTISIQGCDLCIKITLQLQLSSAIDIVCPPFRDFTVSPSVTYTKISRVSSNGIVSGCMPPYNLGAKLHCLSLVSVLCPHADSIE